jgi:hypothetical protein
MVLSLIDPIGPNFIKDFPGQNEVNLDAIDAFAGPSLPAHPLRSFTPDLTSTTTKPTLGDGSNTAYYYEIFDQVYMWGQLRFGTGFTAGVGTYIMGLPFTCASAIGNTVTLGDKPIVGVGSVFDASSNAGKLPVTVHLRTATQLHFGVRLTSGLASRELTNSGYITWAVGDGISWNARFRKVST